MLVAAVLIASVLFLLYQYFTWNNDYWKEKGIPYDEPEFFFGSFKKAFLARQHFGLMYGELYRKFAGSSLVGIFKVRDPVLLIRDPELIRKVLITDFASFTDNDFTVDLEKDKMWATNSFSNKGNVWKAIRSRWVHHLSPGKVKLAYPSMIDQSQVMVDHYKKEISKNPQVEIETRELVTTFFTDSIILGIFGVNINSYENPDNPFRKITKHIFISSFLNGLLTTLFVVIPWIGSFFRFVSKELEEMTIEAARSIMKCQKETGLPNNEIYTALTNYSKADGKSGYTDFDLAGRIFGMLLDGSETTSGPMSFGVFELACHPEIQAKMREEIRKAEKVSDGPLSYEETCQLPYLDMVLNEILRVYPALIHLSRVCTKKITLETKDGSVTVNEGMTISIPVMGIHTDPQYFPEPYTFNPERFSPENIHIIPKDCYLPFGDGPRICLGMKLGIAECKVILSALVKNFELKAVDDPVTRPLPLDPNVFVLRSEKELKIKLLPLPNTI